MEIIYSHPDILKFIKNLDLVSSEKVFHVIKILRKYGYSVAMPYSKMIERDLYELRIKSIQNIRIFYTFWEGEAAMLHIVIKKTQKLEKHDIETARRRLSSLHAI